MNFKTIIVVLGLAAVCTDALADDREAIEEVTVLATRRAVEASGISIAVATTDGEAAVTGQLATDSLQSLLGVSLQQTTPGQGAAIVRGLKGSAILHLVDGMRLSNAMFRTAPTPWFALVPTHSVEHIEAIRGTPASLYGSEAVGGVIQSVSRLPAFDSDSVQYVRDVMVGFDAAELRQTVAATLDAGTRRLAASISADYQRAGNRRVGGGARIPQSGYTSKSARAVVRGTPTERRSWFLDLHFLEQPETPRVDEMVPGFGQAEPSSSEFYFAPNQRIFAHLQHEHLSASGIDWKIDTAWQRIVDDRRTRDYLAPERRREKNRSDLYGLTINASGSRNAVNWISGIDLYHDEVRSSRIEESIASGSRVVLAPRFPDGSTVSHAGVFANVSLPVSDRHRVSAGVRHTHVRIDLPDGSAIEPNRLSGDVGWIFDVNPSWQFVGNIGFGFRAPNIADLGTLGGRPGNRFNVPNPNLDAEDVTHGDLGIRFHDGRSHFEIVLFGLRYADRIVSVSTGMTTPEGRDVVQSVNAASSDVYGVEAGARLELAERFNATVMLNYARGEQEIAGIVEPADRVPPLNGRVELEYTHNEEWRFASWVIAAATQDRLSARDIRDVRIDPDGTAGWVRLGASAEWRGANGWQVMLRADNLLDKRYRAHGSGIDAPGRNVVAVIRREW